MSNTTTATVISWDGGHGDCLDHITSRAESMFVTVPELKDFYHSASIKKKAGEENIIPLSQDHGYNHVVEQLEKTIEAREDTLTEFLEGVDSKESTRDAVQDYELASEAKRLGWWATPSDIHLYDATNYTNGSPVLSHTRLEKISEHHDLSELYAVDIVLSY